MADKAFMSFTQNGEQVGLGHSLLVGGDTMEYRALVSDVAKKIIEDYAGSTLAGSAQSVQAALASLNSNMSSIYGGVPIRKAAILAQNQTFDIPISSALSAGEGFAMLAVSVSGNAISACNLYFLSKGTSKKQRIAGSLAETGYTLTYSSSIWTLTNTSTTSLYCTAIISK